MQSLLAHPSSAIRSEPEQKIEETEALLRKVVSHLSRRYPAHLIEEAARECLLDVRPHLEEALEALAAIEQRRNLTDQELAWQRAFKMLLAATRVTT